MESGLLEFTEKWQLVLWVYLSRYFTLSCFSSYSAIESGVFVFMVSVFYSSRAPSLQEYCFILIPGQLLVCCH